MVAKSPPGQLQFQNLSNSLSMDRGGVGWGGRGWGGVGRGWGGTRCMQACDARLKHRRPGPALPIPPQMAFAIAANTTGGMGPTRQCRGGHRPRPTPRHRWPPRTSDHIFRTPCRPSDPCCLRLSASKAVDRLGMQHAVGRELGPHPTPPHPTPPHPTPWFLLLLFGFKSAVGDLKPTFVGGSAPHTPQYVGLRPPCPHLTPACSDI